MSDGKKSEGVFEGYSEEDVPLFSYGVLVGVFNLIFALFLLVSKSSGRPLPERVKLGDILLFGVATHKVSWTIAKEAAMSPLRAPFTELEEIESPTNVREKPRGTGFRRSIGELLTCHFCLGQWVAAVFAYGLVLFPAATRFAAAIFAMLTVSDHLHQSYKALMNRA